MFLFTQYSVLLIGHYWWALHIKLLIDWGFIHTQSDRNPICLLLRRIFPNRWTYSISQYQQVISRKLCSWIMINNFSFNIEEIDSAAHNNQTRTHLICFKIKKQIGDYPCLCLCFGFSQITLIRPFLLIILHFSQIGFTDALTFTVIASFHKKSAYKHITKKNKLKTFFE